jgi:hypothetical protein
MSEWIAAEIRIGGVVPPARVPKLIEAIEREGVTVTWEEYPFEAKTADDLLELALDSKGHPSTLNLVDHQARWGQFENLEAFLVQHSIAFDRFTEAKYEYSAEHAWFRPGMPEPVVATTDSGHSPVVSFSVLEELDGMLAKSQVDKVRRRISSMRQRHCPPELPPLSIAEEAGRASDPTATTDREDH